MKPIYFALPFLLLAGSARAQVVNGGLESWNSFSVGFPIPTISLEEPIGWDGTDSLVYTYGPIASPGGSFNRQLFKTTTEQHAGTAAAKVMSRVQDVYGVAPGLLTNAEVDIDFDNFDPDDPFAAVTFSGGTLVSQKVTSLSAWIKYLPKTAGGLQDKGQITVQAVATVNGNDTVVGEGFYLIDQPVSSYTQVTVPLIYVPNAPTPNRLLAVFVSSVPSATSDPVDSSTLFVDDVSITTAIGVQEVLFGERIDCSVNPVAHTLSFSTAYQGRLQVQVFGSNGQLLQQFPFTGKTTVPYAWPSGIYAYRISDAQGRTVKKDKLLIP